MSSIGLIAPWYMLENKIRETYGQSEFVNVEDLIALSSGYLLNINVSSDSVAKALRAVLPQTYTISDNTINVVIYDCNGNAVPVSEVTYTAETLAQTFCNALCMNPLFVGSVVTADIEEDTDDLLGDVIVLIKPEVVQFPDGSLDNICNTFSEIAAAVFTEISNLTFETDLSVVFNNFSKNCNIRNLLYCNNKLCNKENEEPCAKKHEIPCKKEPEQSCWKERTETLCKNLGEISFGNGLNENCFR